MEIRLLVAALLVGVVNGQYYISGADQYWMSPGMKVVASGVFPDNEFSLDDSEPPIRVVFANEVEEIECKVVQYLTNSRRLTFIAGRRKNSGAPRIYSLIVYIHEVRISGSAIVNYASWMPPAAERCGVRWAFAGDIVTCYGYFHTDVIERTDFTDPLGEGLAAPRRLKAVYLGGIKADNLNDSSGEPYEPYDSRTTTFKITNNGVGAMLYSVFVTGRGASTDNIRWWGLWSSYNDELNHLLLTPGVDYVTPNAGSLYGGQLMTVGGVGLDPGTAQIYLGNAPCEIVPELSAINELVCLTPPQADTRSGPGQRGVLFEIWRVDMSIHDYDQLNSSHPGYSSEIIQDASVELNSSIDCITILSGYFHPPHDGLYALGFHVSPHSGILLFLSTDGTPAGLAPYDWKKIYMKRAEPVYYKFVFKCNPESSASTIARMQMRDFNTKFSRYETHQAFDHKLRFKWSYNNIWETQVMRVEWEDPETPALGRVSLNNYFSEIVDLSDSDQVRGAIFGLTEIKCDHAFPTTSPHQYGYEDYEPEDPPGRLGETVDYILPYCGRKVSRTRHWDARIYYENDFNKMVDVKMYPYLCYALRGKIMSKARIEFVWSNIYGHYRRNSVIYDSPHYSLPSGQWNYACVNAFEVFNNTFGTQRPDSGYVKARLVFAPLKDGIDYVYVDSFAFYEVLMDYGPVRPSAIGPTFIGNEDGILIEDILVDSEEDDTGITHTIQFISSNCMNGCPLLGVAEADQSDGLRQAESKSANEMSYSLSTAGVHFNRTYAATPNVQGTWAASLSDTVMIKDISADVEKFELEAMIESEYGEYIAVERRGSCDSRRWELEYKRTPGIQPEAMAYDDDLWVDDDRVEGVEISSTVVTEGQSWHDPIIGEYLSVYMEEGYPEVSVYVGGDSPTRAACRADCSYTYYEVSDVPELTAVTELSANAEGRIFEIEGGIFDSDNVSDYSANIGSYECEVTAVTTTLVTCNVTYLPAGNHAVGVAIQPIGAAQSALTFPVALTINSVEPDIGGVGGGFPIVLSGTGLPFDLNGWIGNSVFLGGINREIDVVPCEIIAANSSSVTCIAPAMAAGSVDVSVVVGGEAFTVSSGFTFDAARSGLIVTSSPMYSSVLGGGQLTIDGAGLGDGTGAYVMVGPNECENATFSDTEIICILPRNVPGVHEVVVYTGDEGYASGSASVHYTLKVTGSSVDRVSPYAGMMVYLEGEGFGTNCSLLTVDIGTDYYCDVIECEDTLITCNMELTSVNHEVTNDGSHPDYGIGFSWNQRVLITKPGDAITWMWSRTTPTANTNYNVYQTFSASDPEWDPSGFYSGPAAPSGTFTTTIYDIGVRHYTSDLVTGDEDSIRLWGQVTTKELEESINRVSVKLDDIEAVHEPTETRSYMIRDDCPSLSDITGCNSTAPSANNSSDISIVTDNCLKPTVTAVSASATENIAGLQGNQIRSGVTLTITGTGFGSMICQNSVKVCSASCTVTAASETSLTCVLNDTSNIVSLKDCPVSVTTKGRGKSNLDHTYKVVPHTASVSPTEGSLGGGSLLTITGTGFVGPSGQIIVLLDSHVCDVITVTATEITCLTPVVSASTTATVTVRVSGVDAIDDPPQSTYTFSSSLTPILTGFTSSVIDESVRVTITGSTFGTSVADVTVTLTQATNEGKASLDEATPIETKPEIRYQTAFDDDDEMYVYDEETEEYRSTRRPRIRLDQEDLIEAKPGFWGKFTNTDAKTFEESVRLGAWKIAGSNSRYLEKLQTAHEERMARTKRDTSLRTVMTYNCNVTYVNGTTIECDANGIPAGDYTPVVSIAGLGTAQSSNPTKQSSSSSVTIPPVITGISPNLGGTNGGALLTITGSGFTPGQVTVTLGGANCPLVSESSSSLSCTVPPHAAGAVQVEVTSSGASDVSSTDFTYDSSLTPALGDVSPDTAVTAGMTLTLTGSGFMSTSALPTVTIGGVDCPVVSATASDIAIECTAPDVGGGSHNAIVHEDIYGNSNVFSVSYDFDVTQISPFRGGFGGIAVTIDGTGFHSPAGTEVHICGNLCSIISSTSSKIQCLAPPYTAGGTTVACDVVVTNPDGSTETLVDAFTYDGNLTPAVTSVSPGRGGTAGGTTLTIDGTGFSVSGNEVYIDGSECIVTSQTTTQIICETEPHSGSGKYTVEVLAPGNGWATTNEEFYYVDLWSSTFTWGGGCCLPSAGMLVVIDENIVLDISTPVLSAIIIKGASLTFDDAATGKLSLNAKYIIIVEGGSLSIGSEAEPFTKEAEIVLHGNHRDIEMPFYGAKVIGVRHGTVDLHGAPINVPWTHLASTANPGDTTVTLKQPVDWKTGDEVVIATTQKRFSKNENEVMKIASVSPDKKNLTFTKALQYEHMSITQTLGGRVVETRAEIGLLTRNIKVRGNVNSNFNVDVKACGTLFSPDQFSTQTCFSGQFGAETVTDQFGGQIMMFAKAPNTNYVIGRIENTEFTHMGQAFSLGRYPIHYHLNGNVSTSYVRRNSIHHTYNRAVTIHAVNYLLVEYNVAYNVMGHTFFTEDGNEKFNIIQYNLAIFTRTSSSLLNVDVTPSSFWVVNPDNIVRHNAAAGGTHFGYWYRTERHPSGPSYTNSYCQNNAPMGQFFNNTAHSMGRYGLWVFSMDGYFPKDGTCGGKDKVAKFQNFLAWRCDRGAEVVKGGAIQFHNFVTLDNENAGLEFVEVGVDAGFGIDDGPAVANALVVGHSDVTDVPTRKSKFDDPCNAKTCGIIAPKKYIFSICNTTFVNYDEGECTALCGCSQCKERQGGFRVQVKELNFIDSPNKIKFKWEYETIWIDADGTLTGTKEDIVVPTMGILPPNSCDIDVPAFSRNPQAKGSVCSGLNFLRFTVEGASVEPNSFQGNDLIIKNEHGSTRVPYYVKRLTVLGWMGILFSGGDYEWEFDQGNHITNISYVAKTYFLGYDDYYLATHRFIHDPDSFGTLGYQMNSSDAMVTVGGNDHGDYYYNNKTMTYIVRGPETPGKRSVIFNERPVGEERTIKFQVYRCFFEDCIPPTIAPPPSANGSLLWSDPETWKNMPQGTGGHHVNGTYGLPVAGDSVTVPVGMYLTVDIATPELRKIFVYGTLEFEDTMDHTFSVTIIYIQGGKVIAGTPNKPFTHKLDIILRGSHDPNDPDNEDMPMPIGVPSVGWKAIGAFGDLALHGQDTGGTWLKLAASAAVGEDEITLSQTVHSSWVGKEVMITTTTKDVDETEIRTVTAVSGSTITLNKALDYDHLGETFTLDDGTAVTMAGEVGLLSRNIRIIGNDYQDLQDEGLGGRILVSKLTDNFIDYIGSAQLENVELKNVGQFGFTDTDDPRFSLAFVELGDNDGTSYVKKCSFNKNYNTAIGMFGTNNVTFEDNVFYHSVGSTIRDDSSNNNYEGNLLSVMLNPANYNGAEDKQDFTWNAVFALNEATDVRLKDNVIAGSEQAGYQTFGEDCSDTTLWFNNEVHGAFFAVMTWKRGGSSLDECTRINNFYAWRAGDTAFYMQYFKSYQLKNVRSVDSRLGASIIIYNPASLSHVAMNKKAEISDSLFVGSSPHDTCAYRTSTPDIYNFHSKQRWKGGVNGGNSGIALPVYLSGANLAPKKSFYGVTSYPAIRGGSFIKDTVFAHFDTTSCGTDVAIITNDDAADAVHPVFTSGLTFLDSPEKNKVYFHEPSLSKVNPSDCVDLDCDGLKKLLMTDNDGSFLGTTNATITAIAEFEWGGDPRRGLNNLRIPVPLKQNPDGTQIPEQNKFPNKGIVRDSSCTMMSDWRAWKCTNLRHRMMIIESMDGDTEVRRLSPIALIANPGTDGYVDIVNGPQDVGWCFGYTCQERISTFYTVVAASQTYEVGMTSTPPQHIRIQLLHSDPSDTVLLRMYFPKTQRYDVYVDNSFVAPTNIDTSQSSYQLLTGGTPSSYYPTHSSVVGSNYLERDAKFLHVLLRGSSVIDIKTTPLIILSTGLAVDETNFFEKNIVDNIANLLGLNSQNIMETNIVRESRKRATVEATLTMKVGSTPTATTDGDTPAAEGEVLDYDALTNAEAKLVNSFQRNETSILTSMSIEPPQVPPEEPGEPLSQEAAGVVFENGTTYSEAQQLEDELHLNESLQTIDFETPAGSIVLTGVSTDNIAFTPLHQQPSIAVLNSIGEAIQHLGISPNSWILRARVIGNQGADLLGTTDVSYTDGAFTFTDLVVNRPGEGYTLTFDVVYPENVTGLDIDLGHTFSVGAKLVSLKLDSQLGLPYVVAGEDFFLNFVTLDKDTNMPMEPSVLIGQHLEGEVEKYHFNPKKRRKNPVRGNTVFTYADEDVSAYVVGPLRINKLDPSYRIKAEVQVEPIGWSLYFRTPRFPVLPKAVDEAVTKKISMKGLSGRGRAARGKERLFTVRLNKELFNKVVKATPGVMFKDLSVRVPKKPFAVMKIMGGVAEVEAAIDQLCFKLKTKKIKVRINRQRYIMGMLTVDGNILSRCKPDRQN